MDQAKRLRRHSDADQHAASVARRVRARSPPAISAAEPRLDVVDALISSYEAEVLKHAKYWVFDVAV
jgi:hypothetical protein